MFDIAWSEMLVIGAVALVVIGPKDLPKALRSVGEMVGKVRRMAGDFQSQFNDAMRDAELHDIRKQVEEVGGSVQAATKVDFNPIQSIRDELKGGQAPLMPPSLESSSAMSQAPQSDALPSVEPMISLPEPPPVPDVRDLTPQKPAASDPMFPDLRSMQQTGRATGGQG